MSTLHIYDEARERREQIMEAVMMECQLNDMIYYPYAAPDVDYGPIFSEIKSVVVSAWKHIFSFRASQVGQLQDQTLHG